MKTEKIVIPFAIFLMPFIANAQSIGELLVSFGNLVKLTIPIVIGIALLAFFWGLTKYIAAAGSEDKKAEGRRIMVWGTVALFVMVAIWGIIEFIGRSLDIDIGDSIQPPTIDLEEPTYY